VTPSEANLINYYKYTHSIIKVVAHKSEEPSVGFGTHATNDRSSFTSSEFDCTSNVTPVARKQCQDRHRIIHVEQPSSFEPIPRQNFCDGHKVRFDTPSVRLS
jgi:hypothetical protein